jgi:FecR protein
MRSHRSLYVAILPLLVAYIAQNLTVRAADDDEDDYEVKARVVRVSLINGEVTLKRNGNADWEQAQLNFPIVEGDTLASGRESRFEIQIDARNFLRVDANSVVKIVTLRDEGIAVSLIEGTATVRLAKFDHDHEYFEVDAPQTTLAAEKTGLYRIDVNHEGKVHLTVRDGGRARIYSETSGFALRDGRSAELLTDASAEGDWELFPAGDIDPWDHWVSDRERYLAQRLRYDTQYYDNYVYGAEDLDAYGDWSYTGDYGWIWRPHDTIINNYNDWAPYRYGNWTWCPPYGWTWVGYEPWGWAPYHYGRWVYQNNYWAWCPRSQFYHQRSWWRPALVAFVSVNLSFGDNIYWYPLSYHQHDPRSRHGRERDRLSPLRSNELANLRRVNPAYLRAVTALPARDFGSGTTRTQRANDVLARQVAQAEPLRGDLPVRPSYTLRNGGGSGDRTERITIARPARVTPAIQFPERATGATTRRTGVPLADELRRTRVFNGRDPRPATPIPGTIAPDARPTGAVSRPARPARNSQEEGQERNRAGYRNVAPDVRPERSNRQRSEEQVPAKPDANVERERRPEEVPNRPRPAEGASTTPPTERPARIKRNEPRNGREERNDRPERVERPSPRNRADEAPRVDRQERRERPEGPPPANAPSRRSERSEPSRPSEPPPRRPDPPQQRSEPPSQRSAPPPQPQRSEPAQQRSAPAKAPEKSDTERPSRAERKSERLP